MRASRDEIICGRQPLLETLKAGRRRVFELLLKQTALPAPELAHILKLASKAGITVRETDDRRLDDMTGKAHHQGIAARVGSYPYVDFDEWAVQIRAKGDARLILLLDHVQDPQNLGAILRTAETAGVDGVIIPVDRAVEVTPAVVRASAGASEHLSVMKVTNLSKCMADLKDEGLWLVGLEAVPEAKLYTEADLKGPLGLVVGSEGEGLGRVVKEHCDFLVRLPVFGKVSSLNAGTACAVALYEIRRQRGSPAKPPANVAEQGPR